MPGRVSVNPQRCKAATLLDTCGVARELGIGSAGMDFSRLDRNRVLLGGFGGAVLLLSLLFLPWYSLSHTATRTQQDAWICGSNDYSCTGFDTFPILRWLLILAAFAPLILAWILVRGHKLSWAPGEMTMVAGFAAMVLIAYNGIIDRPGTGTAEIGRASCRE